LLKHVVSLYLPAPLNKLLSASTSLSPLADHLILPPPSTILSLSLLNPTSHLVPLPSRPDSLSAISQKGHHPVTPSTYYTSALALKPDILWAAADTRSGLDDGIPNRSKDAPNLDKQEVRGGERTVKWIGELVDAVKKEEGTKPVLWTELVGGSQPGARETFSSQLVSTDLDAHLSGYTLPLSSLRTRILNPSNPPNKLSPPTRQPLPSSSEFLPALIPLAQASFAPLPLDKPRLASAALSPHEILALVGDAGVDLFDGTMAYEATEMGVAFDFRFPVPVEWGDAPADGEKRREVGTSMYDVKHEMDFTPLVPEKSLVDPIGPAEGGQALGPLLGVCTGSSAGR
jgi:hypothetical protein